MADHINIVMQYTLHACSLPATYKPQLHIAYQSTYIYLREHGFLNLQQNSVQAHVNGVHLATTFTVH